MSDSRRWTLEADWSATTGDLPALSGFDYDGMVRDLVKLWMRKTGDSYDLLAAQLRMPKRELKAFIRGKPGTLLLASRIVASTGITFDEFLSAHRDYPRGNNRVSLKSAMMKRLENTWSDDQVRAMYEWATALEKHPDLIVVARGAFKLIFQYADERGYDLGRSHEALEWLFESTREGAKDQTHS